MALGPPPSVYTPPDAFELLWCRQVPPPTATPLRANFKRKMLGDEGRQLELIFSLAQKIEGRRRPPILFVHGAFGSATVWREYMGYFTERGYSCYAVSLRGHGESFKPQIFKMHRTGMKKFSKDVRAAYDYVVGIECKDIVGSVADHDDDVNLPVVIGHASGAGLLQYMLSKRLIAVRALVMCAPVPGNGSFGIYRNWLRLDRRFLLRSCLHGFHPRTPLSSAKLITQAFFTEDEPADRVREFNLECMSKTESTRWSLEMMRPFVDFQNVMRSIRWAGGGERICIVAGKEDKLIDLDMIDGLAAKLGGSIATFRKEEKVHPTGAEADALKNLEGRPDAATPLEASNGNVTRPAQNLKNTSSKGVDGLEPVSHDADKSDEAVKAETPTFIRAVTPSRPTGKKPDIEDDNSSLQATPPKIDGCINGNKSEGDEPITRPPRLNESSSKGRGPLPRKPTPETLDVIAATKPFRTPAEVDLVAIPTKSCRAKSVGDLEDALIDDRNPVCPRRRGMSALVPGSTGGGGHLLPVAEAQDDAITPVDPLRPQILLNTEPINPDQTIPGMPSGIYHIGKSSPVLAPNSTHAAGGVVNTVDSVQPPTLLNATPTSPPQTITPILPPSSLRAAIEAATPLTSLPKLKPLLTQNTRRVRTGGHSADLTPASDAETRPGLHIVKVAHTAHQLMNGCAWEEGARRVDVFLGRMYAAYLGVRDQGGVVAAEERGEVVGEGEVRGRAKTRGGGARRGTDHLAKSPRRTSSDRAEHPLADDKDKEEEKRESPDGAGSQNGHESGNDPPPSLSDVPELRRLSSADRAGAWVAERCRVRRWWEGERREVLRLLEREGDVRGDGEGE